VQGERLRRREVRAGSGRHAPDSKPEGTNVLSGGGREDRAGGDDRTGLTREISRRIEILRILLICGIVVLHTPPTWPLEALPPEARIWPGAVKLFFDYGPFRAGVPTLSLISGYLLFLRPYGSYWGLVRRKLVTLVVPFLLWNGIVVCLHGLRGQNDLIGLDPKSGDALAAWSDFLDNPPDYPTYFLVDLFTWRHSSGCWRDECPSYCWRQGASRLLMAMGPSRPCAPTWFCPSWPARWSPCKVSSRAPWTGSGARSGSSSWPSARPSSPM
jgi:hypothetical protein